MAGRTAVTAPGHPTQHALALRDTDSASVCRLQERGGWAGSHGMLRSSSWGWSRAESARCLLIPETCSPGTPLPQPAGTHQRDKDPQVQESKTSLNLKATSIHHQRRAAKGLGELERRHMKESGRLPSTRPLHCQQSPATPCPSPACCPPAPVTHSSETKLQAGGDILWAQVLWGQGTPARPSTTVGRGTDQKRDPHIFKSPSGHPCPQGGPAQEASNGPCAPNLGTHCKMVNPSWNQPEADVTISY